MEWFQVPLGPLQTNCYILAAANGKCLIVDPGGESDKLIAIIENKKLQPEAVILTHAHFDHIGAVDGVRKHYAVPVYIHKKEADWLTDPALNGSHYFMAGQSIKGEPADYFLSSEQNITIGSFTFAVLETPGHSPGSVSFYFRDSGVAVAGDALFQGSIGRTDLPGGNHQQLLNSIHEKLLTLPEETSVLPGHGPVTTIGDEMDSNPFLNGF
jgi:glyoxylase-like metal-dependent hydrolase (beta-lactamase superfamily II)